MARPVKRGLTYFPLDTHIMHDRKIQRLILKCGLEGVTIYMATLCEIYATNGYFIPVTDELYMDICFSLHIEEKKVRQVVGYCVELRLFHEEMFRKKHILTSYGIQQRYVEACKRTNYELIEQYVVPYQFGVNVAETLVNVTLTGVSAPKENKRKEKEIKEIKEEENKKEKTKKKESIETKQIVLSEKKNEYEKNLSGNSSDAARRAELLRMAADATASSPDA